MDTRNETRYDRQRRLQSRNDRNALITGLAGIAIVIFGLVVAGTSTGWDGEPQPAGGLLIAGLGAVAIAAGFYFRGRPVR